MICKFNEFCIPYEDKKHIVVQPFEPSFFTSNCIQMVVEKVELFLPFYILNITICCILIYAMLYRLYCFWVDDTTGEKIRWN